MPHSEEPPASESHGKPLSGAVAHFRQSQLDFDLEFFDALLAHEPEYIDVLRCQAELLARQGLHELSLPLDRRLTKLLPADPYVHYNLACSQAMVGDRSGALRTLRLALELGYDDFELMRTDRDLSSVRDEPEYQALLRIFAGPDV